ncbi:ATP-binding cassette domain-containing protein [Pseudonocardia sp. ICBG601]|uniref:ABC transporter ATP-binding protein n=1 Tax=Pseudonocardia sp. ICBG601 TaxID=2846759 RepID=UPI0027E33494|nr:ATP-binding cassette domain-containing protein [Pseudonocardia sp. ICBG601]
MLGSYLRRARRSYQRVRDEVYDMFPVLHERRTAPAGLLSGGEQQMLAFGRALMTLPTVVVLDEPSMGLSPRMVGEIMAAVRGIRERGLSVLMVEQNAAAALTVADDVYVMRNGRIVLHGDPATIDRDAELSAAFPGCGGRLSPPLTKGVRTPTTIPREWRNE